MITRADGSFVNVDGLKTFYVKAGSGPAVILIHGAAPGGAALVSWKLNIEPLARAGFTVYAYDQPGFGYTENPADHSIEYRVSHARAFIDALKLDRYHVIGNSVGGYVAARLALEDPRAQSFVTTSSGTLAPRGGAESQALAKKHGEELRRYTPSLENMRELTLGTIFHRELVTDDLVRERYEMSAGKNYEAQLKRQEAPAPRPIHEELRNLQVKSLLLWGNRDRGVTVERGLLLFELIPNAEFHLFDNCAHWVQWDRAERFNRIVADFVAAA
ncbi:MAG TPA: alpha/beta hydrolase [Candidatus Acidoferrales bacterium]|nr:alpha/beta hydrolase [Candidatus Acidoferrales bacterium]